MFHLRCRFNLFLMRLIVLPSALHARLGLKQPLFWGVQWFAALVLLTLFPLFYFNFISILIFMSFAVQFGAKFKVFAQQSCTSMHFSVCICISVVFLRLNFEVMTLISRPLHFYRQFFSLKKKKSIGRKKPKRRPWPGSHCCEARRVKLRECEDKRTGCSLKSH